MQRESGDPRVKERRDRKGRRREGGREREERAGESRSPWVQRSGASCWQIGDEGQKK